MPAFYVLSPSGLPEVEPIEADTLEAAIQKAVDDRKFSGGRVVAVPADQVKMFDLVVTQQVDLVPRDV